MTVTIGVLGIQGAVTEHIKKLEQLPKVKAVLVKSIEALQQIDGLILPGGESTSIARILQDFQIFESLQKKITAGLPVWGTCAGMILLAKKILDSDMTHLGVMHITVKRNAYGRQLGSFSILETVPAISDQPIPLVFIRAPFALEAADQVEILHILDGKIVACREQHMLATAFHPELTDDLSFHRYFVKMVQQYKL